MLDLMNCSIITCVINTTNILLHVSNDYYHESIMPISLYICINRWPGNSFGPEDVCFFTSAAYIQVHFRLR